MAHLLGLPVELQLMIGSYLPKQIDYYNLSLVCRSLRPIDEQLLYSNPELDSRLGQSLLFARTVLSNPKIGKWTKSLWGLSVQEISGRFDKHGHDSEGRRRHEEYLWQEFLEDDLDDPWPWGWPLTDEIAATIQEVQILTDKFLENLNVCKDSPWRKIIHTDLERAIGGALLVAMPNLTKLELNQWRHLSLPAQNLTDTEILLGKSDLQFIKCLQSLEFFQTSGAIPWPLIPHLRNLKGIALSLEFGESVAVGAKLETSAPLLLESVMRLTLFFDVTIFLPQSNRKLVYVRNFLACCPNMDTIDVVFGDTVKTVEAKLEESIPENENWGQILKALYPVKDGLRQLNISFSDVTSKAEDSLNYLYNLKSWNSLSEFTKLDCLSVPYGALTDQIHGSGKIYLPGSLTTLNINRILMERRHSPWRKRDWRIFAERILNRLDGDKIPVLTSLTLQGDIMNGKPRWKKGSTRIKHKNNMAGVLLEWAFRR